MGADPPYVERLVDPCDVNALDDELMDIFAFLKLFLMDSISCCLHMYDSGVAKGIMPPLVELPQRLFVANAPSSRLRLR